MIYYSYTTKYVYSFIYILARFDVFPIADHSALPFCSCSCSSSPYCLESFDSSIFPSLGRSLQSLFLVSWILHSTTARIHLLSVNLESSETSVFGTSQSPPSLRSATLLQMHSRNSICPPSHQPEECGTRHF